MMDNYCNTTVYSPLLTQFFQTGGSHYTCGYPHGPFIPYAMSGYRNAPLKVFYLGRDTYYWAPKEQLFNSMQNGTPDAYLKVNSEVVTPEDILKYNNQSGSFWNFVAKLHLYVRTGCIVDDINTLSEKDKQLISEIGYGNLNAIEVQKTLENEGTWPEITSVPDYRKLCQAGRLLDNFKTLLDAYHPDYVVILTWDKKDDIFDGLNAHFLKDYYRDGIREVYEIEGYNTKLIWSVHPRRFSFMGTNVRQMILQLGELFD